ncbi:SMI1/KNR4 family protein [Paenibacillus sp. WLX2291]|uniref:SMI1/KNR4 family protein n=1 Tax=Paenibacillus sp. WLX2291 TaxID=3296934 RepID=UPI003983FF8C
MQKFSGLKQRYETLFGNTDTTKCDLVAIEKKLEVKLPEDFKGISEFFNGGLIGEIDIFSYCNNVPNIVDETLRLREAIHVPDHFVILAEPDASIILLDTEAKPAVIWCDSIDINGLENRTFSNLPDTWDTFLDFFLYVLYEEESSV